MYNIVFGLSVSDLFNLASKLNVYSVNHESLNAFRLAVLLEWRKSPHITL